MNSFLCEWLAIVNLFSFLIFFIDKRRAIREKWRISESFLFFLCFLGGSLGGLIAMKLFHHKTRKWKFRFGVPLLAIFHFFLFFSFFIRFFSFRFPLRLFSHFLFIFYDKISIL